MSIFLDWENKEHPYPFLKFVEKTALAIVSLIVAGVVATLLIALFYNLGLPEKSVTRVAFSATWTALFLPYIARAPRHFLQLIILSCVLQFLLGLIFCTVSGALPISAYGPLVLWIVWQQYRRWRNSPSTEIITQSDFSAIKTLKKLLGLDVTDEEKWRFSDFKAIYYMIGLVGWLIYTVPIGNVSGNENMSTVKNEFSSKNSVQKESSGQIYAKLWGLNSDNIEMITKVKILSLRTRPSYLGGTLVTGRIHNLNPHHLMHIEIGVRPSSKVDACPFSPELYIDTLDCDVFVPAKDDAKFMCEALNLNPRKNYNFCLIGLTALPITAQKK